MKIIIRLLPFLLLLIAGCKEENYYEQIVGRWVIDEATAFGFTVQGDGSYLMFDGCDDPPCSGIDYEESDKTTGFFSYEFIDEGNTMVIIDTDTAGGSYDGAWEIDVLTNKRLEMSANTIFGSVSFSLDKE